MRTSYILSVCTDWKENSLKIIAQCLNQGHQAELFNTSVICYKSFKFPVGDYEILSKVSLCSESHVSWPAESRLRRMRLERFHTINHCLLPLALLLFCNIPTLCSVQPSASLLFSQLFLMLTEPPTKHSFPRLWLFIPQQVPSCLLFFHSPLLCIDCNLEDLRVCLFFLFFYFFISWKCKTLSLHSLWVAWATPSYNC